MPRIGSILHGAYGDYYEQLLCLKHYKDRNPGHRLVLFFASEHRLSELKVFDLSWADETHLATALVDVPIDSFLQYQAHDPELRADVLDRLPPAIQAKIDTRRNLKPWQLLRTIDMKSVAASIELSHLGRERLPDCIRANGLVEGWDDPKRFTVGFLWRYRAPGGAISNRFHVEEENVLRTKAETLGRLIEDYSAHVLVCGMNVKRNEENFYRIEAKYTECNLGLDSENCTYLKGLSWGLELEILCRCSLCLVMPSGFSEALWMKRAGSTVLVDPPPHYLAKLLWNRMPLFNACRPVEMRFQFRQPHTADRVLRHLQELNLLPD